MSHSIKSFCASLIADEEGLTTVEYALLLGLMVVAAIGVWTAFGAKVGDIVDTAGRYVT